MIIRGRLLLIAVCVSGCAIEGQMRLVHEPRFTTYAQAGPAPRAGYPSDFPQLFESRIRACNGPVSGYDFMFTYASTGATDPVTIQRLQITRRLVYPCGEDPVSGTLVLLEVFRRPANDVIAQAFCGESENTDQIDGRVAVFERGRVGADVLAQLAQITSGQNVVLLNSRITDHRFQEVRAAVERDAQISWQGAQDYDGCNLQDPSTSCGAIHCFTLSWQDSTAAVTSSWTGGR